MPSIYRTTLSIHFFSKNTIGVDTWRNYIDTWLGVDTWRGVDTWPDTWLGVDTWRGVDTWPVTCPQCIRILG